MNHALTANESFMKGLWERVKPLTWAERIIMLILIYWTFNFVNFNIARVSEGLSPPPEGIDPGIQYAASIAWAFYVPLGLVGVLLGAWANTIYRRSQDTPLFKRDAIIHDFNRTLTRVPTMIAIANCIKAIALGISICLFDILIGPILSWALFTGVRRQIKVSRFISEHAAEQAAKASEAAKNATEARMAVLRAQMNPHFLFNALNTVASLVRTSREEAEQVVEGMSTVLRRTLVHTETTFCSVEDELAYLKAYLEVEEARMGDRLKIDWHIAPDVLRGKMPSMILQPLVENAVEHGIAPLIEGGHIGIEAKRDGDHLLLIVRDNGVGLPADFTEETGLTNPRRRLETLYGDAASLNLESQTRGTKAEVRIPCTHWEDEEP